MAIRTKDELLTAVRDVIGEDNDKLIPIIEDITDTISDLESKSTDSEDWKAKYEENDKAWKKKYTDRFFGKVPEGEKEVIEVTEDPEPKEDTAPKHFEDLFSVVEKEV